MSDLVQNTPVDQLAQMLSGLSEADRAAAKMKLRMHKGIRMQMAAEKWSEAQMPSNMTRPIRVQIKEAYGAPVVGSWHLLGDPVEGYRPILPGEVVVVDLDHPDVRASMAKGYLSLSSNPVTRPIVYKKALHAEALDPAKRKYAKIPESHTRQAFAETAPVIAQIEEEFEESRAAAAESQQSMPPALAQTLAEQEIAQELQAEGSAPDVATETAGGTGEDGVKTRRRRRA